MSKVILIILLILSIYTYVTITPLSRSDVNHNVVQIPHHIGSVLSSMADRITEAQTDKIAEVQIDCLEE